MRIKFDDLKKTVADFQTIRLLNDQTEMLKFEDGGRNILYNQLAEAYRIGLLLLTPSNGTMFCNLLMDAELKTEAKKYGDNKAPNPWAYVTKLLYGKWVSKQVSNTVFHVFEPNRSAEKYAVVFRYLADKGIQAEKVAQFIADFVHEKGNALIGIERVARRGGDESGEDGGSGSDEKSTDATQILIGRSRDEADIFEFELPAGSAIKRFGYCFFEVVDGKAVALGATELEQPVFEEMAAKRGREILKKAKAQKKAADDIAKMAEREIESAKKALDEKKRIKEGSKLAKVKERLMGDPDWADALAADVKQAKRNQEIMAQRVSHLEHLDQFFEKVSSSAGPVVKKIALIKHLPKAEAEAD